MEHLLASVNQVRVRRVGTVVASLRKSPPIAATVTRLQHDCCRGTAPLLERVLLSHEHAQLASCLGLVHHAIPLAAHRTHTSPPLEHLCSLRAPPAYKPLHVCIRVRIRSPLEPHLQLREVPTPRSLTQNSSTPPHHELTLPSPPALLHLMHRSCALVRTRCQRPTRLFSCHHLLLNPSTCSCVCLESRIVLVRVPYIARSARRGFCGICPSERSYAH